MRYVANAVTSFDTVTRYLSLVKRLHEFGAMAFPAQVHLLKFELMVIKKELMHLVKKAPPIMPTILLEIAGKVDWTREEEMVAYAALVIGFTLFLRKSNLVSESVNSFNKKEQLTVEDVWCHQELVMVEIKWSKTLQTRDKELVIPLVPAKTQMLCAAGWVKRILRSRRKVSVGDPLFGYQSNGLVIPLTYDKLSKRLKEWVSATGRDGQEYTLHGLCRGGGGNQALTVGIGGQDIQLMGDWKSNPYMEYLDLTLERKLSNMVKFVDETDALVVGSWWLNSGDRSFETC